MQYNGQINNEFRYKWNNYKDNNRKSLRGEDYKQAGFSTHFQTAGHISFISGTGIRFIDKTDTLKFRYPRGLIILTHAISYCICIFTSYHRIYGKCLFLFFYNCFIFWEGVHDSHVIFVSHIYFSYACNSGIPLRRFSLVLIYLVTCLLVLVVFIHV